MIKKSVTVNCEQGLDARPIALLVQEASQYASQVYIEMAEKKINAKSIMGMMSLSLTTGEELSIIANGDDEEIAANGMVTFISDLR